jgi:hypothetical protein
MRWSVFRRIFGVGAVLLTLAGGAMLLHEVRQMRYVMQAQQLDVLMLRVTLLGLQTHVTSVAGALSRQIARGHMHPSCAHPQPVCTAGVEED